MNIESTLQLRIGFSSRLFSALFAATVCLLSQTAVAAEVKTSEDWQLQVTEKRPRFLRSPETIAATVAISPSAERNVEFERYDSLAVFQPNVPVWAGEGTVLRQLRTHETSSDGMLVADSLRVYTNNTGTPVPLTPAKDYAVDKQWAVIGRLPSGPVREGQAVYASYQFYQSRLDAIVLTRGNKIVVREGAPTNTVAQLPPLAKGDKLLATVWVPGRTTREPV